ncbi:hypothetical protein C8R47DRAFT_1076917 [Mycena vitilis]|nr:hypothetical protein C8R47DRAFT_1076917 [Mycena vitilis]
MSVICDFLLHCCIEELVPTTHQYASGASLSNQFISDEHQRRRPGTALIGVGDLGDVAFCRLSETVFGNPSRDFTLVDNPGAPIERQAGYSYPQSVGRGVGLLVLFEGVFGGPYSDRDRRSTTLEGAEGRRYLGRRGKGGLAQGKSLSPTDRFGEELWISRAIGGVGKEFLSPCMPSEIRLSGFHDNPGVP